MTTRYPASLRTLAIFLWLPCALGSRAHAQTATPSIGLIPGTQSLGTLHTMPINHLYFHFFRYQQHLDTVAAQYEKAGKPGTWLSAHFETTLGLSDADMNNIRAAATTAVNGVTAYNSQAHTIHAADIAALKAGTWKPPTQSPGYAQLQLLNQDREALLTSTIANLNSQLGATKAAALQSYIQAHVATATFVPKMTPANSRYMVQVPK